MSKTYAQLLSEHPQFNFEPGMLVLFHNSKSKHQKMRLRSPQECELWGVADELMEPVLGDHATAGVLVGVLEGMLGDYQYELWRRSDVIKKCWAVKIPVHTIYEEGDTLGQAVARTLLRLWDEKKLNVPKLF